MMLTHTVSDYLNIVSVLVGPVIIVFMQRRMKRRDRVQEEIRANTSNQNNQIEMLKRTALIHSVWLGLIAHKLDLPRPSDVFDTEKDAL